MVWNHLNDQEDEKSFVVTLFVAVCWASSVSSLFFLRAQCPLKLTSSFSLSNRKLKNNFKKINRESWPYACACSSNIYTNVRFGTYSRPIHDRDTEFEKSKSKTRNKWHVPFVPISLSIFQIRFPETGWRRENRKRDQRLCANLPGPTYLKLNTGTPESKLPILTNRPIFKKWQNTGIPTHSLHGSHAYYPGADLH